MIHTLKKFAEGSNITIKFVKGWKDDFRNILTVFEIGGKKYCLLSNEAAPNEFSYCFGIGSTGAQTNAPVGKGNYLIGNKLESGYADIIADVVKSGTLQLQPLPNKNGASWAPANEGQKTKLADLVAIYAGINKELQQLGIVYSEGDRYIFGKDLTVADVTNWAAPTSSSSTAAQPAGTQATGNVPNIDKFIAALAPEFQKEFGQPLQVGSTHRTPIEQAKAMAYPIRDGVYDSLYKSLPEAPQIKQLIQSGDFDRAAEVIKGTGLMNRSHMAGKAIDIPFSKNNLKTDDWGRFDRLVRRISAKSGIQAKINRENQSHFHIGID
jgi:hypothetical protein